MRSRSQRGDDGGAAAFGRNATSAYFPGRPPSNRSGSATACDADTAGRRPCPAGLVREFESSKLAYHDGAAGRAAGGHGLDALTARDQAVRASGVNRIQLSATQALRDEIEMGYPGSIQDRSPPDLQEVRSRSGAGGERALAAVDARFHNERDAQRWMPGCVCAPRDEHTTWCHYCSGVGDRLPETRRCERELGPAQSMPTDASHMQSCVCVRVGRPHDHRAAATSADDGRADPRAR